MTKHCRLCEASFNSCLTLRVLSSEDNKQRQWQASTVLFAFPKKKKKPKKQAYPFYILSLHNSDFNHYDHKKVSIVLLYELGILLLIMI